jgi:hypothetical protein
MPCLSPQILRSSRRERPGLAQDVRVAGKVGNRQPVMQPGSETAAAQRPGARGRADLGHKLTPHGHKVESSPETAQCRLLKAIPWRDLRINGLLADLA